MFDLNNLNPLLAPTGRVSKFVSNPDGGTLPASCTMHRLTGSGLSDYQELFEFVQTALVTAAGVSVHLPGFKRQEPGKGRLVFGPHEDYSAIYEVQDSMFDDPNEPGYCGIINASFLVYSAIMQGETVYLYLGNIRAKDTVSSKGQVSSGPKSFRKIFESVARFAQTQTISSLLNVLSTFNAVIRRGGIYKNGAVVSSLPIWHPDFSEYVEASGTKVHPYLFKSAIIPSNYTDYYPELVQCVEAVNNKDLWLEKVCSSHDNVTWLKSGNIADDWTNTLGHNVCKEITLKSNGTCIIMPINFGMALRPEDLVPAMSEGMELLCEFQKQDYQSKAGIYLSAQDDKQVGLGLMGLANLLANHGLKYSGFIDALELEVDCLKYAGIDGKSKRLQDYLYEPGFNPAITGNDCESWVAALLSGFAGAAKVANRYGMERAFGIAPTASVSFRYTDFKGYTVCPEYSPPLSNKVERLSQTKEFESTLFEYPPNVETCKSITPEDHFRLTCALQYIMDSTGLGHSISWNVWGDMDFDKLEKWLDSNLKSTYYLWETDQSFLDKTDQLNCGVPTYKEN